MSECASSLSTNVLIEDSNTSNIIPSKDDITNSENNMNDSEDDNDISFTRVRAKSTRFAESDSETDKENNFAKSHTALSPLISSSDDDSSNGKVIYKKKSRIKSNSNSDSESQTEQDSKETYQYELTRTKLKSKKLQDKFKSLKKSTKNGLKRSKCKSKLDISNDEKSSDDNDSKSSDTDDGKRNEGLEISEDENSCLKIKQNVVNKSVHILASICDPDTSDEESNFNAKPQKPRQKSTKLTSPKPVRMTAKVAMENMQKIKSESNRMLREKEVSLPYHRPKALSLKDIMSRRRPALTSDGKSLPIKMNNEQLQHYASLLEQRQKEMIELCKSDTEDEEENCPENLEKQPEDADESLGGEKPTEEHGTVSSEANDKMFDITIEQSLNESKESNLERQSSEEQFSSELQLENVVKVNDIETVAENLLDQNKTPEINTETQNISSTVDAVNENIINDQSERQTVLTETVTEVILNKVETSTKDKEKVSENEHLTINDFNKNTEEESQIISLHYDTDRTEAMDVDDSTEEKRNTSDKTEIVSKEVSDGEKQKQNLSDEFSDNDFTIEDLDRIIEDAEINKDISNKPNISNTLKIKPKLTGVPGMVINLDEEDSSNQNKLTGVELLKERYTYFAKLKSLEDKEKDREKKFKPGIQHLKLKQELEEQIAEKRSLEWEKRLEEESKLKDEMNEVNDGEGFDGEDIEKIEAKLEETEVVDEAEDDSSEEEIEDDVDMTDKKRKRNPMVDDEAEESEDENTDNIELDKEGNEDDELVENGDNEKEENSSESDEDDDDSSESELDEEQTKPKKGRILKAFEDSDDEEPKVDSKENPKLENNHIAESQDDDIQLAQLQRSYSEDLFTSQECSQKSLKTTDKPKDVYDTSFENDLGTQTFSILKSSSLNTGINNFPEKLDVLCETQPCSDDNFDAIVGMCTGNFVENLVSPQAVSSQLTQSQELGDDVAALCTGKFYDNPLISQSEIENVTADYSMNVSNSETQIYSLNIQDPVINVEEPVTKTNSKILLDDVENPEKSVDDRKKVDQTDNKLLKSILDELDDPEFDVSKPNKYFFSENINQDRSSTQPVDNTQAKKKFIIESDDETNGEAEVVSKKKKRKKRKLEDRALQFSDDEEDISEQEEEVYESDIEDDNNRLVEYDSEENEVEIQAKPSKKKRVGAFFEQEAELTSEDEWVGSGDEDEAGLDRMEREEGDDDTFHQGKLQRELGEIHMREVLDQDKREVRLLQELLFEDGDLGDGHRQRKFRWKNADGEEEIGTNADEYADTQEDEFESEEQWRKQRHEREMFLRSLQEKDEEDANVTINRSALIKANLSSNTTPNIADKVMNNTEKPKTHETEKKTSSDIPSPKKPFTIFQQSYHNSLLTRGRGALARLAALATPLAGDDDAPKVNASSARGNFVFAAITPEETEPKVTKRKADANPDTPRLLKKMRKQDSNKNSKISILDHL